MIFENWHTFFLGFFHTISQILTAGIAITAFSLFLHVLTFNLKERVTRAFSLILICVVIVFTGDAIGSVAVKDSQVEFWLHLQWIGIIFLSPAYLNFSDALLTITGKPSRWRRVWAVRISYIAAGIFLLSLPFGIFVGDLVTDRQPAAHLQPTAVTGIFSLYYLANMAMSWYNLYRAFRRTTTPTSRRRMGYLIVGAFGPAIGSFPFLLFSSNFASQSPVLFWLVAATSNLLLGGLVVVMAYAVAFFGVPWPDRVIKSRMLKWIMRGPVAASFTLALTTILRRLGVVLNFDTSVMIPVLMTMTILIFEYMITLLAPVWEQWLFWGNDRTDLEELRRLEDRLITRNDLRQFLEMLLAAVCDSSQAKGAYIAVFNHESVELLVKIGKPDIEIIDQIERLNEPGENQEMFHKNGSYFLPLAGYSGDVEIDWNGLMGITGIASGELDEEQTEAIKYLAKRAAKAVRDRKLQTQSFQALQNLAPEVDMIQLLRAQGSYDGSKLLQNSISRDPEDVSQWVKEALTHYWGGPKLTQNPLIQLRVVQEALEENDGNPSNALRSILRKAIEQTRPVGERRFTADWILYNILELKFLEGRKVREVAARLAMSEADLYRKQRIAVEAVAKAILAMEQDVNGDMKF